MDGKTKEMEESNSDQPAEGTGRGSVGAATQDERAEIWLKIRIQEAIRVIQSSVPRNHHDWYRLDVMKEEVRNETSMDVLRGKADELRKILEAELKPFEQNLGGKI